MSGPKTATTRDDGHRTYPFPPTGEAFTSITTILSESEGKQAYLVPWSARLAAEKAVDNLDTVAGILAEHGPEEGRAAAVAYLKDTAKQARELKADVGTHVHDVVEALILWADSPDRTGTDIAIPVLPEHLEGAEYDDEPVEDVVGWMVEGFLNFIGDWKPVFRASEMTVFNPALKVAGTLDIIAELPGVTPSPQGMFVPGDGSDGCIDVKTGKHASVTWPEQCGAYRRSKWALMPMGELVPMPPTKWSAVLHLRPEYERGYRLMLISGKRDALAWNRFRRAVEIVRGRQDEPAKPGRVCYPPRPDGTIPGARISDLDGEGYGRILTPLTRARIGDVEQLAAMTEGQCLQVKGIGPKSISTIRLMLADHGLSLAGETLAAQGEAA